MINGCSKCLKHFPSNGLASTNYSGFQRNDWVPRDTSSHRLIAEKSKVATTKAARETIERQISVRYSELLLLPYFDVVRFHLVHPMHNLFLGTSKYVFQL